MLDRLSLPLAEWVNRGFETYMSGVSDATREMSGGLEAFIEGFENLLLMVNPVVWIIVAVLLVGLLTKRVKFGVMIGAALVFTLSVDLWKEAMETLALVLTGTLTALLLGVPLGICAGLSSRFERIIRPVLDLMQTLPSFVYLIPAVMFFGLGKVAALVAILIFAMPPAIRLTNLGIRQVPADKIEASQAFGANKWQMLFEIQLPLALKTIMTGVNQCIMMALSMSVIAAMIGAGGLGRGVLQAMQRVDIGMGIEGGLVIVILAIMLDRMTEHMAKSRSSVS